MFTGLIEARGAVVEVERVGQDVDLTVDLGGLARRPRVGDSVALSGVCCTVVRVDGTRARFRLSEETLRRTWLGEASAGREVNLEAALRAGDPLGGHLVQGHVDGLAEVVEPVGVAGGEMVVRLAEGLVRYCAEKGSIALDGVSLTVAGLVGDRVRIAVIPHTAEVTTLGGMGAGERVHVEVDVLAKYVERMLEGRFG